MKLGENDACRVPREATQAKHNCFAAEDKKLGTDPSHFHNEAGLFPCTPWARVTTAKRNTTCCKTAQNVRQCELRAHCDSLKAKELGDRALIFLVRVSLKNGILVSVARQQHVVALKRLLWHVDINEDLAHTSQQLFFLRKKIMCDRARESRRVNQSKHAATTEYTTNKRRSDDERRIRTNKTETRHTSSQYASREIKKIVS